MAKTTGLEAVTLDFWGTVVDAGHSLVKERAQYLANQFHDVSLEQALEAYGRSWEDFQQATNLGFGLSTAAVLSRALEYLERPLRPSAYQQVLAFWQTAIIGDPPPLLPGLQEALETLRGRGYFIGLISDTGTSPGSSLRQVLRDKGVHRLFDWFTFSDELGVTKTRPQAFWSTLAALGVAPERAIHVGDLPHTDIDGAHRAGLYAALVLESSNRREGIARADMVLDHLRDLPDALEAFEAEHEATIGQARTS